MKSAIALIAGALLVTPTLASDWTPHSAAALLDASFPTAEACEQALADARRHESRAHPVHGLSYRNLFAQGRCHSFHHESRLTWRIRMHWKQRQSTSVQTDRSQGPNIP
ncbi:hypothetical protein [Sphingomonas sp. MMS24-J13]|uniref:hypothetical protein n=1 Tax=Sphingomonas sp. MMS24-J13 TaxID=3238686 RepID=UPI00384F8215